MTVSMSGERVRGSILDIYKVERFALQQIFMKEQMRYVLAGLKDDKYGSAGKSALQMNLEERADAPSDLISESDFHVIDSADKLKSYVNRLDTDFGSAFHELSEPAIDLFSLEDVDAADKASLTHEQRVAARFKR